VLSLLLFSLVGPKPSSQFYDLVKAIGEIRSKQEEDRIMTAEVTQLKGLVVQKDIPTVCFSFVSGHNLFAIFGAFNIITVSEHSTRVLDPNDVLRNAGL